MYSDDARRLRAALREARNQRMVPVIAALDGRPVAVPYTHDWQTTRHNVQLAVQLLGGDTSLNLDLDLNAMRPDWWLECAIIPESWTTEATLTKIYRVNPSAFILTELEMYEYIKMKLVARARRREVADH